jgi:uncharacterized lipoprotein YajG
MRTISIIFVSIILAACATPPQIIKVPVTISAQSVELPPRPILPVSSLTAASTPDEIIKAYVASLIALNGWATSLATICQPKTTF